MVCLVLLRDFSKWISTHFKINKSLCNYNEPEEEFSIYIPPGNLGESET